MAAGAAGKAAGNYITCGMRKVNVPVPPGVESILSTRPHRRGDDRLLDHLPAGRLRCARDNAGNTLLGRVAVHGPASISGTTL